MLSSTRGVLDQRYAYIHFNACLCWHKIIKTDNIILQNIYKLAYNDCINGRKNWLSNVRKLLNEYGFNNVWDNPENCLTKSFIHVFKQRVIDCFLQDWNSNIENSGVLELYRNIKEDFSYEKYLDILPGNLRTYFCKIRLSAHSLRIQTGRYARNRIPRNERYCQYCNTNDLEDEFHFVLICPCYSEIRNKLIKYVINLYVNIFTKTQVCLSLSNYLSLTIDRILLI